MNVYFLSDFFSNEIIGGAEICNEAIKNYLLYKNINVKNIRTSDVTVDFLKNNKNNKFLIANFFNLSNECKEYFSNEFKNEYIIIEHDHKYTKNNNPSIFIDFVVPENFIINKIFFQNAKAVLCQSKLHAEIISKNLFLDNLINLAGNVWDEEQIKVLESNTDSVKDIEYAVFQSSNKNKGMSAAIQYCEKNNINYTLLPLLPYQDFIPLLARVKNLIFFPQWVETFSRVSVEAKILKCNLITNKLIGAASEDFFKLDSKEIIDYIKKQSTKIPSLILDLFQNKDISFYKKRTIPKISIITSVYNGSKFIEKFLIDITRQTIFDKCELILIDANSPDNEFEVIKPYLEKYKNIIYYRCEDRISVQESMNLAIKKSSGEYITIASLDDRRAVNALEIMATELLKHDSIDLVYFDCYESKKENEIFEECKNFKLYEHSMNEFTKENMIKCLPGPMPMWKKRMSDKNGKFDESLKYAGDWEFWLRSVKTGSRFLKINKILGVYYNNPAGLSTSQSNFKERFLEERDIFIKYKDIIGEKNYNSYKGHFNVS
jgi:hypothetical protein